MDGFENVLICFNDDVWRKIKRRSQRLFWASSFIIKYEQIISFQQSTQLVNSFQFYDYFLDKNISSNYLLLINRYVNKIFLISFYY